MRHYMITETIDTETKTGHAGSYQDVSYPEIILAETESTGESKDESKEEAFRRLVR